MIRFPWQKNPLDEKAREIRGRLAEAVVSNDRERRSYEKRAKESPISDLLDDMFKQLDEAKRRG